MFTTWTKSELAEIRLDPGFYAPEYARVTERVMSFGQLSCFEKLRNSLCPISYGVLKPQFVDEGSHLIRNTDFDPPSVRIAKVATIPKSQSEQFHRSIVDAGDLLVTIGGYVGTAAIVPPALTGANINRHIARIRLDVDKADPYFYWAFVQSPSGTKLLERWVSGTAQPGINLGDLKTLFIPWPDLRVQRAIGNNVRKAQQMRAFADATKQHFAHWLSDASNEAELPLSHRAYLNHSPGNTCSDAAWITDFDPADRIDPWAHHVAIRSIRKHLKERSHTQLLGELFEIVTPQRERVFPPSDGRSYYLSILDVDFDGRIDWSHALLTRYDSPGVCVQPGDILLSTLNPQEPRVCYIDVTGKESMAASPEFAVLRLKDAVRGLPFVLCEILRSLWIRVQSSFLTRSSSLSRRRIAEEDLKLLLIPWNDSDLHALNERLKLVSEWQFDGLGLLQRATCEIEELLNGTLNSDSVVQEGRRIEEWLESNRTLNVNRA